MEFREKLLTFFSLVINHFNFGSGKSDISMSFVLATHIYSFLGMSQSWTDIYIQICFRLSEHLYVVNVYFLSYTLLLAIFLVYQMDESSEMKN